METLLVAVVAVMIAAASAVWDHNVTTWPYYWTVLAVGTGGGVALLAAIGRRQRELAGRRFDLLMELSRVGNEQPSLGDAVERLGALLVPEFTDVCILDVVRDGHLERLSVKAADPRRAQVEAFLRGRGPAPASNRVSSTAALASGRPILLERVTDEALGSWAQDEDDLAGLRELRANSTVVVPLHARGQDLGRLTFIVTADSRRRYRDEDLEFASPSDDIAVLALRFTGVPSPEQDPGAPSDDEATSPV